MNGAIWAGLAIVGVLVAVFVVAFRQAGVEKRPLAGAGGSGLVAVFVAVGVFLIGASLAAGLDVFVLAPPMLLVGLLLLVVAGVAALQAA